MDYQLVLLIGMVLVVLVAVIKAQMWSWPMPGRPGYEYQRVITAVVVGLLFFVSGLVGWDTALLAILVVTLALVRIAYGEGTGAVSVAIDEWLIVATGFIGFAAGFMWMLRRSRTLRRA
jgi:hypothetical protein